MSLPISSQIQNIFQDEQIPSFLPKDKHTKHSSHGVHQEYKINLLKPRNSPVRIPEWCLFCMTRPRKPLLTLQQSWPRNRSQTTNNFSKTKTRDNMSRKT